APAIAAPQNTSARPASRKGSASAAPRAAVWNRLLSDTTAAHASRTEASRSGPPWTSGRRQSGRRDQTVARAREASALASPRRLREASSRNTARSKSRYAEADVSEGSSAVSRSTLARTNASRSSAANPTAQAASQRNTAAAILAAAAALASASRSSVGGRSVASITAPPLRGRSVPAAPPRIRAAAPRRRAGRPVPGSAPSTRQRSVSRSRDRASGGPSLGAGSPSDRTGRGSPISRAPHLRTAPRPPGSGWAGNPPPASAPAAPPVRG